MKHLTTLVLLFIFLTHLSGQDNRPMEMITCFIKDSTAQEYVLPPATFTNGEALATADFVLSFGDSVPAVAQAALTYAASIWETRLVSSVPIQVGVFWEEAEEERVLASAGPTTIYRDFPEALDPEIWYPVALAESLVGENLNEDNPDIQIFVNSGAKWYYGIDGMVPPDLIDLVTVTLHELGHGLGFLSSADTLDIETGILGFGDRPIIYDVFLQSFEGLPIIDSTLFPNPSAELLSQFTDPPLFFGGPQAIDQNGGERPLLFTPGVFDIGSSVSHLDEFAFPTGGLNSLMSPRLARREAIHSPGDVTLGVLADLGWEVVFDLTAVAERAPQPLVVYPNPTRGLLQYEVPRDRFPNGFDWQLIDGGGRSVRQGRADATQTGTLALTELPQGIYLLRIRESGSVWQARVVKQ